MTELRATRCNGCHKVVTYDDDDTMNATKGWAFIDCIDSEPWRGTDLCPECMTKIQNGALRDAG